MTQPETFPPETSPLAFTYVGRPARVLFGTGTRHRLADEVDRLGARRALVLCTGPQRAQGEETAALLGPLCAGVYDGAVTHTPVEVSDAAAVEARRLRADVLVAIGGGSTTGLAKAIALRSGLPQIVLPTTYAGSEMTPILGETAQGRKTTQSTDRVLPQVVIYDVALTMGLPLAMSVTSGLNAVAHAIEALYARDRNPIVDLMALEAIGAMTRALPALVRDPSDAAARSQALYAAWLGGLCLGSVGMALHHKLCHTLGGSFDLPHAETHTVLLPHALAYNAPAIPGVMTRLQGVLGPDPARALQDLAAEAGVATSLKALGMPEAGLERAADLALANPYWNPRPIRRAPIRTLLARAHAGLPPQTPDDEE